MSVGFKLSSSEIKNIGERLVSHLKTHITDTARRSKWSEANFCAIQSFRVDGLDLHFYPSGEGKDRKPAFLFDLIAYVQGKGILIAVESEWLNSDISEIKHDFEKLLYVRSPIKLLMCRVDQALTASEKIKDTLLGYMKECCSEFSSGEMFILYCVNWQGNGSDRGDIAYSPTGEG